MLILVLVDAIPKVGMHIILWLFTEEANVFEFGDLFVKMAGRHDDDADGWTFSSSMMVIRKLHFGELKSCARLWS